MNSRVLRALFAGVMLAIGIFLLAHGYSEDRGIAHGANFSPLFYPKMILWGWVGLSFLMLVQALFLLKNPKEVSINWFPLVAAIGLIALFCGLMHVVGFVPVCLFFMLAYSFCLGYRRPVVVVVASVVFTMGVWYVFNNILSIPLPEMPFFEQ